MQRTYADVVRGVRRSVALRNEIEAANECTDFVAFAPSLGGWSEADAMAQDALFQAQAAEVQGEDAEWAVADDLNVLAQYEQDLRVAASALDTEDVVDEQNDINELHTSETRQSIARELGSLSLAVKSSTNRLSQLKEVSVHAIRVSQAQARRSTMSDLKWLGWLTKDDVDGGYARDSRDPDLLLDDVDEEEDEEDSDDDFWIMTFGVGLPNSKRRTGAN